MSRNSFFILSCLAITLTGCFDRSTSVLTLLDGTEPFTGTLIQTADHLSGLSSGGAHTCAITSIGNVKCWGANTKGQLGNNSTTDSATPVLVQGLANDIIQVSSGADFSCALLASGQIKCWGANDLGQLGNNSTVQSSVPVDVTGFSEPVKQISVGFNGRHACALTQSGKIRCWGNNFYSQLGKVTLTAPYQSNVPVDLITPIDNVVQISSGVSHTCALQNTGSVLCWGGNYAGQLGISYNVSYPNSVEVPGLKYNAIQISSGAYHTCAVTRAHHVKCWGDNTSGQLGNGSQTNTSAPFLGPTDVLDNGGGLLSAEQISAGFYSTCSINQNGGNNKILCWGDNFQGKSGADTSITPFSLIPISISVASESFIQVSVGVVHSCGLTLSGAVKCWGQALQNGSASQSFAPVNIGL